MFNLLVTSSNGWNPTRDTLSKSRVLEYTAEHLRERFTPGDSAHTWS